MRLAALQATRFIEVLPSRIDELHNVKNAD